MYAIILLALVFSTNAKIKTDGEKPKVTADLFDDLFATPSKIGADCKNSTRPYVDKKTGITPNASSCDSLVCPKGYRCEDANDTNPFTSFVVCCDAKYSEQFDDADACPNGEDPLPSSRYPGPIWSTSCKSISKACAKNSNYSCIATTKGNAKCCRTESWKIKTKKHCPFGTALKKGGKEPTCGRFFLKKGDSYDCPADYKCIEREGTSYCCPAPGAPSFLLLIADIFNETCLNATADMGTCYEKYLGVDTGDKNSVFDKLNISNLVDYSQKAVNLNSVAKGIKETKKSKMKISHHLVNISAAINETELAALHKRVCGNYSQFKQCNSIYANNNCHLVQFVSQITTAVLDVICSDVSLKELFEALECFANAADADEVGVDQCADLLGAEIDEDLTFGFDYLFSSICPSIKNFFACMKAPMVKTCKSNGAKHADFVANFMGRIFGAVFGPPC